MRDDLLDTALDELRADTPAMTDEAYQAGYARVLAAPPRPPAHPAPRWRRRVVIPVAAAAAVAITLAGALVLGGNRPEVPATPAQLLDRVVAAAAGQPVLAPGQFRYVRATSYSREDETRTIPGCRLTRIGDVTELWVPADPAQEWLRRYAPGEKKLQGCKDPGDDYRDIAKEERAPYGQFPVPVGRKREPGTFWDPTVEFLASLPRDPRELYRAICDSPQLICDENVYPPRVDVFQMAAQLAQTSFLPPDLRAAVYRMMGELPGIKVTESGTDDGRRGVTLTLEELAPGSWPGGPLIEEIVIDPATGELMECRTEVLSQAGFRGIETFTYGITPVQGVPPGR
ncbi:CU044_5270 family protein [Amycolatopsis suaedae]|uniref:CU044_5270 family protein n=1 Tax=Amycolatopsis suaedae TaxID=2510978 RepID=A0A4Q7IY80_9PSEU|nr:CU044_5270 family protein [Amycolatopsis suaedae]RZQ59920.1 hypothetical protein EWH70_31305 [Amycolatopsis suaedae]